MKCIKKLLCSLHYQLNRETLDQKVKLFICMIFSFNNSKLDNIKHFSEFVMLGISMERAENGIKYGNWSLSRWTFSSKKRFLWKGEIFRSLSKPRYFADNFKRNFFSLVGFLSLRWNYFLQSRYKWVFLLFGNTLSLHTGFISSK